VKQGQPRDYRLDFCRGLALIVIFIDHVPANPLSKWTMCNFAFCDAAEVFVLISGIASYLAYGSRLEREGFRACSGAVGRRWTKLYFAHLLLLAILAIAVGFVTPLFSSANYIHYLRMEWLFAEPRDAIVAALTLRFLPAFLDILPLYLVLLALAPALIYVVKRDWRIALAASAAMYAVAQWTGINLSAGNDGSAWYFNPLAWQFLYTVGIVVGHFSRVGSPLVWRRAGWLLGALAFAAFGAIAAYTTHNAAPSSFQSAMQALPASKTFLAPLRLLNLLALLYVFAYFVSPQAGLLRTRVAAPLLWCGRNSLTIYGIGVFLSCAGFVAVNEMAGAQQVHTAVNLVGITLMIAVAATLEWRRGASALPQRAASAEPIPYSNAAA
jgi:hypothetical protein